MVPATPSDWQIVNSQGEPSARGNPPQGLIPTQIFNSNPTPAYCNLENLTDRSDATSFQPGAFDAMTRVTDAFLLQRSPFPPGSSRTHPSPTNLTNPPFSDRADTASRLITSQIKQFHSICSVPPQTDTQSKQPVVIPKLLIPTKTHKQPAKSRKKNSSLERFWDILCLFFRVLCCCFFCSRKRP